MDHADHHGKEILANNWIPASELFNHSMKKMHEKSSMEESYVHLLRAANSFKMLHAGHYIKGTCAEWFAKTAKEFGPAVDAAIANPAKMADVDKYMAKAGLLFKQLCSKHSAVAA